MKQRLLLAACATVLVAACSDREDTGSDNPTAPGTVAFTHQGEPHACSFRDAKAYAQDYFKLSGDRNAARTALSAADDAELGSETRNNALFTVLELVAKVGGNGSLSNGALIGANLVQAVVRCGGDSWLATDWRNFHGTLVSALTDKEGGFAVVGGASLWGDADATDPYVFAESGEVAFGLNAYHPDYTAPQNPAQLTAAWTNSLGRTAVVLGDLSQVPDFGGLGPVVGVAYRLNLIYTTTTTPVRPAAYSDNDAYAVEFCSAGLVDLAGNPASPALNDRVSRLRSSGTTVLQTADLDEFCDGGAPGPVLGSHSGSSNVFARMVDRVIDFFNPAPLQAMMFVPPWSGSSGGQGGTSFDDGSFSSDYGVVEVNAINLTIDGDTSTTAVDSIPNTTRGTLFTFSVLATSGTATLEDVDIRVSVAGNQGDPVLISGTSCDPPSGGAFCTLTTEEDGKVTFTISLNKSGGYTLLVEALMEGIPGAQKLTNLFIVSGN